VVNQALGRPGFSPKFPLAYRGGLLAQPDIHIYRAG